MPLAAERQGERVCNEPVRYSGNDSATASHSCATPIVATSTMTRGDRNSRRITVSSMTVPVSVPTSKAPKSAGQIRPAVLTAMIANRAVAGGRPCCPTAKLMTRLDR